MCKPDGICTGMYLMLSGDRPNYDPVPFEDVHDVSFVFLSQELKGKLFML